MSYPIKPVYAAAVAYLTERGDIHEEWHDAGHNTTKYPAGILFRWIPLVNNCLTTIKFFLSKEEATNHHPIFADLFDDFRVPSGSSDLSLNCLPAIAEWNSRLDDELPRETPECPEALLPYLPVVGASNE